MPQYYQISPYFRLSSKESDTRTLQNTLSNEIYLINDVIHTFLSFFEKSPITFAESVARFAVKYDSEESEIITTVNQFFSDMYYKSILLQIEELEHILVFPKQKEIQELDLLIDFDIIEKLAEEYFSSIYVVKNKKTTQKSVLKILHLNAFFKPEEKKQYRKAFLQEINIAKEINGHPNIIQLLDADSQKNIMLIELEYVKGIGLRQYVLANPKLSFSERCQIYKKVLEAYSHLHFLDVLHGDIHASNILVQDNHGVKLIDFDMSYHNTRQRGELINKGGVQPYIAPEKISNNAFEVANKRADFRSEVYQIGIIGYILFLNKLPFEADSWKLLASKIKKENPIFDDEKLPTKLVSFLQRAMSKKTKERFASAVEMLEEWDELSLK